MNRDTDLRTNARLVACSRSHGDVDPARSTFRINDMSPSISSIESYSTLLIAPPSTCTVAPVM
jgi:hypothetical protein